MQLARPAGAAVGVVFAGLLAGALGCAATGPSPETGAAGGRVVAGTTALQALDGRAIALSDHAGAEATVLAFFATW